MTRRPTNLCYDLEQLAAHAGTNEDPPRLLEQAQDHCLLAEHFTHRAVCCDAKERIVARMPRGDYLAVDERDVQTVMELLWEIRDEVRAIRDLLEEDDDGEEEAGEEDT